MREYKKNYLCTPMERHEFMRMPIDLIPPEFAEKYDLYPKVLNGYVYMRIVKGMYGLPQAGMLANNLLKERLQKQGSAHTGTICTQNQTNLVHFGSRQFWDQVRR